MLTLRFLQPLLEGGLQALLIGLGVRVVDVPLDQGGVKRDLAELLARLALEADDHVGVVDAVANRVE